LSLTPLADLQRAIADLNLPSSPPNALLVSQEDFGWLSAAVNRFAQEQKPVDFPFPVGVGLIIRVHEHLPAGKGLLGWIDRSGLVPSFKLHSVINLKLPVDKS